MKHLPKLALALFLAAAALAVFPISGAHAAPGPVASPGDVVPQPLDRNGDSEDWEVGEEMC